MELCHRTPLTNICSSYYFARPNLQLRLRPGRLPGTSLPVWLSSMRWLHRCRGIDRRVSRAQAGRAADTCLTMPIFHECQRCTACCRWPGQVRLTEAEVTRLAAFKQLAEWEFIQRFTRLTDDRRGLALLDKPDGQCVFLEGNDCSVQPVKPQQCRDFPNLWNFPGFEKICQAIPRLVSEEEHRRLLAEHSESHQ